MEIRTMYKVDYLTMKVYNHTKTLTTNIGQSVYDALNTEAIRDIVLYDGKYFYFEHNQHHDIVPQRVYDWIIRYLEKQGYSYGYKERKAIL